MKESYDYDERQQVIRTSAYKHGYTIAIVLLVIDSLLSMANIVWAEPFAKSYIFLGIIVYSHEIECILRGAYFDKYSKKGAPLNRFILYTFFTILQFIIRDKARIHSLVDNGRLTNDAAYFVWTILYGLCGICILIYYIRDKLSAETESGKESGNE